MFQIAYVSSAVAKFTRPQLCELLERSRAKNDRLEITGLLLYQDGNFMQVVEGPEAKVRELYHTVSQDPRHRDVFTLLEENLPERGFPNWAMAFHDVDHDGAITIPGFSDFLKSPWTRSDVAAKGDKARKLLAGFKERLR